MKNLIKLILLTFVLVSCDKNEIIPENSDIVGNWSWIETSGGFAGIYKTPSTEGYQITITYKSDATYTKYKDGNAFENGNYSLFMEESRNLNKKVLKIKLSTDARIIEFNEDKNKISLSDDVVDGFNDLYYRISDINHH